MPFLKGIATGIVLMFMLGPSFFYLIRVAIVQGFKKAIGFALGILLSDLAMMIPIFFGMRKIFESQDFQVAFGVVASTAMIFLGIKYLSKKQEEGFEIDEASTEPVKGGFFGYIVKGFSLNIINPFTVMLWVSVPGVVKLGSDVYEVTFFLSGLAGTILCLDFLKAFLANKLAKVLNAKTMLLIDKILGVVLLGFSIRFIYHTYIHFDTVISWFDGF